MYSQNSKISSSFAVLPCHNPFNKELLFLDQNTTDVSMSPAQLLCTNHALYTNHTTSLRMLAEACTSTRQTCASAIASFGQQTIEAQLALNTARSYSPTLSLTDIACACVGAKSYSNVHLLGLRRPMQRGSSRRLRSFSVESIFSNRYKMCCGSCKWLAFRSALSQYYRIRSRITTFSIAL